MLAALAALVVGLTSVYLGFHWFSDALGGWAAGALVLLALPCCEPFAERVAVWIMGLRSRPGADPAPRPVPAAAFARMPRPVNAAGRRGEWADGHTVSPGCGSAGAPASYDRVAAGELRCEDSRFPSHDRFPRQGRCPSQDRFPPQDME